MRRAETLTDALAARAAGARAIAGGTDVFPSISGPVTECFVDLAAIGELRGITHHLSGWRIGGAVTWSEIIAADMPAAFDALKQAARQVGSVQIQNTGTLAGNLCNASPAADGVPPLLALDAAVELTSRNSTRCLPLGEFITGPRQTALGPEELLTAILVPDCAATSCSAFEKLGSRTYLVISIAMVAVVLEHDGTLIQRARVSVGACSAVALRLPALEAALTGAPLQSAARRVVPAHFADLAPISDVRASAQFRTDAVPALVRRALDRCGAP